jgi:hypothetical protein
MTDAQRRRRHDGSMQLQIHGLNGGGILSALAQIIVTIGGFTIGCIRVLARYGTSPQTVAAYGSESRRANRGNAWSKPAVRITFLPYSDRRRI